MGSVVLPHLKTGTQPLSTHATLPRARVDWIWYFDIGWHVDQAIMSEEDRLVVIRFGRDWDPDCMRQDEILYRELSFLVCNKL